MNKILKAQSKTLAAASLISLSLVTSAQAALPTGVATFFSGLEADFNDLLNTYGYTLMLAVTGGLIIFGLVQKVGKRAAK